MHCACSFNPDKSFTVIRNHLCLSGSISENAGMALNSIGLLMELAKALSCGICGIGMSENPAEMGTVVGMAALLLGSDLFCAPPPPMNRRGRRFECARHEQQLSGERPQRARQ